MYSLLGVKYMNSKFICDMAYMYIYLVDMHAAFHCVPKLQSGKNHGHNVDNHISFEGCEQ